MQPSNSSVKSEEESERGGNSSETVTPSEMKANNWEDDNEPSDEDGEKETSGCVLWDLSSSEEHAHFMVRAEALC